MDDLVLTEEDIRLLFEGRSRAPEPPVSSGTALSSVPPAAPAAPTTAVEPPTAPAPAVPPVPQAARPTPKPVVVTSPAAARYHSRARRLLRTLASFGLGFALTFALLNVGPLLAKLHFWWQTDIRGKEQLFEPPPAPPALAEQTDPLPANTLIIPKIGVTVPVVWESPPQRILHNLSRGVVHYQGTARPNDRRGNVFLVGHSSGYPWDPSPYTTVFANLDKLVVGDRLALTTDTNRYLYRVTDKVVVRPTQLEVLEQTERPIVSLMTCTPVGTNLRRLVVRAELLGVVPLSRTDRDAPTDE